MKISILTPDLSNNCLGRAYLLAKILQRHYEVEIVGPIFGKGIWEPVVDDKSITYKSVKIRGRFKPYWQIKELAQKIDGNVVYASKPLFTSFGVGLIKKLSNGRPLILDIDDWQMGFTEAISLSFSSFKYLATSAFYLYDLFSYWNTFIGEKMFCFADKISVSNSYLQKKFGGEIICHARDTNMFDPAKFDKTLIRKHYGIKGSKQIVMFFGTLMVYKGVEELIKSVELIKNHNIILVVAGLNYKSPYCLKLVQYAKKVLGKDRFIDFGLQPFRKIPEFMAIADVVVIPQRETPATIGQMPAKVFDAMAMGKPIIATNVSDLPEVLNGCGWITEPGNTKQLSETIEYVLDNKGVAKEMGWKTRQKCIDKYSWDAVEKVLVKIFKKYEVI